MLSSAGRASPLQGEGHRFDPCSTHQIGAVVQLVRISACHAEGRGFESRPLRQTMVKTIFKNPVNCIVYGVFLTSSYFIFYKTYSPEANYATSYCVRVSRTENFMSMLGG